MISMTGYAFAEKKISNQTVSVEIKSLNSRFLDLSVSLPPSLSMLEFDVRNEIAKKIYRGKVDVTIRTSDIPENFSVRVNTELAASYAKAFLKIGRMLGSESAIPISLIVNQEGVLQIEKETAAFFSRETILEILNEALSKLCAFRKTEGENIFRDIMKNVETLETCAIFFSNWKEALEKKLKENLQTKFFELLKTSIDEKILASETANFLVKYTINEEVVRLESHLQGLKKEMQNEKGCGKKIDFFCQEINREINTIASKNQLPELDKKIIEAKTALENIREQTRNIE